MAQEPTPVQIQEHTLLEKFEKGRLVETVTSTSMYSVEVVDGEITKVTPIEEES